MARRPRRSNLKPPGKCIFCGGPGLTKEHIFSTWMHPLFDEPPSATNRVAFESVVKDKNNQLKSQITETKPQHGSIFTKKVKVVCGKTPGTTRCNDTWMSRIETQAKPYLMALINGEKFLLPWQGQLPVAAWIAVKTIVVEYVHLPTVAITERERRYVWHHQRPPLKWKIWIGWYRGADWKPASFRRRSFTVHWAPPVGEMMTEGFADLGTDLHRFSLSEPSACNTQATTFVIGDLLIHVISSSHYSVVSGFGFPGMIGKKLQQLWPPPRDCFLRIFHKKIKWPPSDGLNDDDVAFISDAFFDNSTDINSFPTEH